MLIYLTLAYLSSTVGTCSVLITRQLSEKVMSFLYGSAAGIMMAACFLSLLTPSLESHNIYVVAWFLGGVFLVMALDHIIPHESALTHEVEGLNLNLGKCTKLLLTMTMHNLVQGLALGMSFSNMIGIGLCLQNLPEGAATALPLWDFFRSKRKCFLLSQLLSFIEVPACFIGYLLKDYLNHMIYELLAFSAGILLYTIIEEIIPDAWSHHHRPLATFALFLGFSLMLLLNFLV